MSNGLSEDWMNTREGRTTPNGNVNWLRHRLGSEAALIDEAILEGRHTATDIAVILARAFPEKKKSPSRWLRRVLEEHVPHLQQTWNGGATGQVPHNLVVKTEGVLRFDVSRRPPPLD